ncbi:uncharacterized protein BCR38DRAFT_426532 [Pseudomassariella vexata]|uniref:Uncharacterized protein n=1 Tax=Pseudomassariella vexata TaxID=1141098 RepID=A0A1Y2E6S9_9PEZI|nr:uncharacterized protein BCR38DRAFT_426532 [Pseudomassariella vexata]ORY67270.1 hypothetical protein BCR38DRAFT_426532 [Pseudomassariella vexata]
MKLVLVHYTGILSYPVVLYPGVASQSPCWALIVDVRAPDLSATTAQKRPRSVLVRYRYTFFLRVWSGLACVPLL